MRGGGITLTLTSALVALSALTLTSALGGCHREPTFDERYASAQTTLNSEAAGIDAELAARASEAAAGDQAAGDQAAGDQAAGVQAAGVQAAGVQAAGVQAVATASAFPH